MRQPCEAGQHSISHFPKINGKYLNDTADQHHNHHKWKSNVIEYKEFFKYEGVELEFEEDALREIARETIRRKTGARGLRAIMENILKDAMYNVPSEKNVEKCIVRQGGIVDIVEKCQTMVAACF